MSASSAELPGVRQLLLLHAYLPLVSVQATPGADRALQALCHKALVSALLVLQAYGDTARFGLASQTYRVTNTQLVTRSYALFPVRFQPPLAELLAVHPPADDRPAPLFSISALELLTQAAAAARPAGPLYPGLFRRVVTCNRVVPFDTLNHPVAHVFVVHLGTDSVDAVRRLVVAFRNLPAPRYVQTADVLVHVFVLYDPAAHAASDIQQFQAAVQAELQLAATAVPVPAPAPGATDAVLMPELDGATIDQEAQSRALQQARPEPAGMRVPALLDAALRAKVFDFVARCLIPHMERRVRVWDDAVLAPRKSLAGRFFSVSRKLFTSSDGPPHASLLGAYNATGGFYPRLAPEQILRKLADWALMLKDFRYAYSTYDMLRRDYTNDKAWAYVAACQEMCIVSLLLAQTQPVASDTPPAKPDKNTLRKIRHDIVEPYMDNLSYTYKLRLNVKTYAVRAHLVVAELLLAMSMMFNIPWWWSDLIDECFLKAELELAAHLAALGAAAHATRAVLYERMGFAKQHCFFVPAGGTHIIADIFDRGVVPRPRSPPAEGHYMNSVKLVPHNDNAIKGLTRFRKSGFWYIMAMREWVGLGNAVQISLLADSLTIRYADTDASQQWYSRDDLVLARVKRYALEAVA
ncbi:hypothetical protein METBIDRAFT_43950 [Metschnikowia bicuspidata var. bicuspidata NRRL YB-4993]|uniref:Uncharacterized protein n=1 Tax=Metschnikowia bicuspidata var. bicuspidata NRRL YB-4993 TaxID=869754 RepID=A0A1A0H9H2_9ASCO|nr:hypothetical protein METBIDRAFT_43950 [Metschnikowia bicuspidata var. bicuspidata NRRL YB-4993]OBA20640.1 hypothetical protein METBIDRAFT_43950 [Metschnikowia bicuspidata var. bicuspidata NRRL YB-4993]